MIKIKIDNHLFEYDKTTFKYNGEVIKNVSEKVLENPNISITNNIVYINNIKFDTEKKEFVIIDNEFNKTINWFNGFINKLFMIIFIIGFVSCNNYSNEKIYKENNFTISIIELDNCEYFLGANKLTHKGNCKNKIHCYNK